MSHNLHLSQITLSNFATFELQEVTFNQHFNAIVGETGSGKSLLLDAIQLILGHRADKKLIRKDCKAATVEATFKTSDKSIKDYFETKGYPFEDDEIIIKRIIYSNGKSKAFINYQSCSLNILSEFSKRFIDLVGQFENQKLLSDTYQLVLLDNFSKNQNIILKYKNNFQKLNAKRAELSELLTKESSIHQQLDYINFQLNELNQLDPNVSDEAELVKAKDSILNKQERMELANNIMNSLDGDDLNQGVLSKISTISRIMESNELLFDQDDINKVQEAYSLLSELSYAISKNNENDLNEDDIDNIVSRLDDYQRLKRKFSTDTQGLEELVLKFTKDKNELENFTFSKSNLEKEIKLLEGECLELAEKIHVNRTKFAKKLSSSLTEIIQDLKMNGATIKINCHKQNELNAFGITKLEFLAETNPGEGFHPIKEIASGGELSRILLALRQVVSTDDTISVFLFDEIDTGIGGETAISIGKALKAVSLGSQVIAITHLPQIALFTDNVVRVNKHISNENRTYSEITTYSKDKIKEVVEIMNPLN
jgi:DNA repair protein RecN (Recombination protein N)